VIRRTLDTFARVVGRPAQAWLSSAIRGTLHTPAFLKEFGLIAYCDYLNDDQPYLIHTANGPIVCVPYSNDINDFQSVRPRRHVGVGGIRDIENLFRSTLL
jgi:hypothetical protein